MSKNKNWHNLPNFCRTELCYSSFWREYKHFWNFFYFQLFYHNGGQFFEGDKKIDFLPVTHRNLLTTRLQKPIRSDLSDNFPIFSDFRFLHQIFRKIWFFSKLAHRQQSNIKTQCKDYNGKENNSVASFVQELVVCPLPT